MSKSGGVNGGVFSKYVIAISELDEYLEKSGPHKYTSKKMVRGKWVYEYKDDVVKRVVDLLLDFLSNPARTVTLGQVARSFRVNKEMAKEVVDSLVAQKKIVGTKNAKGLLEYRQTIPEEVKPKPVVRKQVKPEEKPKQVKVDPSLWHIESVGGGPKEYYLTDEGARKADSIGSGYTESKAALLRELASRGGKLAIERIVGSKMYLTPFGEDFSGLDLLRLTGDGAIESVDPMPGYGRTYRLTDKGRDKIERMDGEQDDLLRRVRNTEKPEVEKPKEKTIKEQELADKLDKITYDDSVKGRTGYFKGDKFEYTGRKKEMFGGMFFEFKYLEGHQKGQIGYTQLAPEKKEEPPKVLIEPPKKTKKELQAQKKELQREANKIHGAGGQLSLDFTVKLAKIDDKIVKATRRTIFYKGGLI